MANGGRQDDRTRFRVECTERAGAIAAECFGNDIGIFTIEHDTDNQWTQPGVVFGLIVFCIPAEGIVQVPGDTARKRTQLRPVRSAGIVSRASTSTAPIG